MCVDEHHDDVKSTIHPPNNILCHVGHVSRDLLVVAYANFAKNRMKNICLCEQWVDVVLSSVLSLIASNKSLMCVWQGISTVVISLQGLQTILTLWKLVKMAM